MLEKMFIRKFTLSDCEEYWKATEAGLALTERRIAALEYTKVKNPEWAAYDKYADAIVGIDIRIEEQYAAQQDLEYDLQLLTEREDIITGKWAYSGKVPKAGKDPNQLGFFDSPQKRERIGAPC